MPRTARVIADNQVYHVLNRGNGRGGGVSPGGGLCGVCEADWRGEGALPGERRSKGARLHSPRRDSS